MDNLVVNSKLPLHALIGSSEGHVRDADNSRIETARGIEHDVASASHQQRLVPERCSTAPTGGSAAGGFALLSRAGTLLGTVGVALLPKCPACWSVYAGLSGWLGLSLALDQTFLRPLTLICLGLTLLVLAHGARRSGRCAPLFWAALAAAGVYLGKFTVESPLLAHVSLGVLVLAALLGRRAERCSKLAQHT